jgi:hypothetical protein
MDSPAVDPAPFDPDRAWEYENGFYLTSTVGRAGKALAQYELYQQVTGKPGDVVELGVYKAASLVRWLTFRTLLEAEASRRVWGFDAFGSFPADDVGGDDDQAFIRRFEDAGGDGLTLDQVSGYLDAKGFTNYELVPGDVRDTLPKVLEQHPELRISLLHLDLDVYEPTTLALELLTDRIVPGGLILIDDYGRVEGATRATDELCRRRGLTLEKLAISHVPAFIRC